MFFIAINMLEKGQLNYFIKIKKDFKKDNFYFL